MKHRYPAGWYLYAVLATASSVVVATGLHRAVYSFLRSAGVPPAGISVIAGLANLSWYEIAYAVGGGLKSVLVYDALPLVGCATGLLSGAILLTQMRHRRHALFFHLAVSLILPALGMIVLLWRMVRGMPDPWRIGTVLSFLAASCGWTLYFRRTGGYFRRANRGSPDSAATEAASASPAPLNPQ